jgi:biotin operon repressor
MAELNDELLTIFKALADPNRLKMLGLLAQHPYCGEELSALLGLKASTISHHLSKLAGAGLVSARTDGHYYYYQLEEPVLHRIRHLFSHEDLISVAASVDGNGYDRKVIGDFTRPDGSLKEIPAQRKKLEAILRYVARDFEPGKRYGEKQINKILSRYHIDTATLRRELVAAKIMEREGGGGEYWRIET